MDSRFVQPDHVLLRNVGDEILLLNTSSETYYSLNAVGARFYELVCENCEFESSLSTLIGEFEVEPDTLKSDCTALLQNLIEKGLILENPL